MTRDELKGRRGIYAVPYPTDYSLKVQAAFEAWVTAYEEYRDMRLKDSHLKNQHLNRINDLFESFTELNKYSTAAA